MHNFSMLLTQTCLSRGLVDESYAEWLTYSIEKRLTTLSTLFLLCLIGFFGFGWKSTLSFSVFFLLIRKYTNGYHAIEESLKSYNSMCFAPKGGCLCTPHFANWHTVALQAAGVTLA